MKSSLHGLIPVSPSLLNHLRLPPQDTQFSFPKSQSQSYFTTGGSSWRQAPKDTRPDFFYQLNPCGNSPYVTSSMTTGLGSSLYSLRADQTENTVSIVIAQ
jgi:hypothetical protein